MNNYMRSDCRIIAFLAVTLIFQLPVRAQNLDFDKLQDRVQQYTVIVDMSYTISFGLQTSEGKHRFMGTIVSRDGLVIFDGSFLSESSPFASVAGFSVKTTPTEIEITTIDGYLYSGEYVGVDRFTRLGFLRIEMDENLSLSPIEFVTGYRFAVGQWLGLYMLLPEFVSPPLAADIGMVSNLVESPELFPLTLGFSPMQQAAVLFDERLNAVGVLGSLLDPTSATSDRRGMLDSYGEPDRSLLGVITGERLEKLILDPPKKGKIDRGWLGISLQALTDDIGEFLGLNSEGGIIVNDVISSSPAENSGLLVGDIILSVNGQPVEVDREEKVPVFQRMIAEMGPGTSIEFTVFRPTDLGGDTLRLLAMLEPAPMAASDADEFESELLEMKVRNIVFSDYMILNLDQESFFGVVLVELKPGGFAMIGGLRLGDIIQQVGNSPVESVEDLENLLSQIEIEKPTEIIFFIWRNNKTLFINVKTDWP